MTRYRLKNLNLQQNLDLLTNGAFSKTLNGAIDPTDYYRSFIVDDMANITISFLNDAFEPVAEYDPGRWNRYPETTPPEDVWMCLEVTSPFPLGLKTKRYVARFKNGNWEGDDDEHILLDNFDVTFFRPWEDPE